MEDETVYCDYFASAFIGIGQQFNKELAVYDLEKCIDVLVSDGMTYEDACEYMDFNVLGAWVGDHTPVFVRQPPTF